MVSVFEPMCVPNYGETLLFVQKRNNDWTIFFQIPRLFTCSISSCDSDILINIFDNFFDNCDELTRVLELLFSYIIDQNVFSLDLLSRTLTRLAILKTDVSSFSNLFIL